MTGIKDSTAHRSLHVTSPLMRGDDVSALQTALKGFMEDHKIDWLPLSVDGQYGPQTHHAARFTTWVLGLGGGHRRALKKNNLAQATQRLIRNPEKRSRLERLRAKKRQPRLAAIREKQHSGPAAAVAYAKACIGITESPAGSNSGPTVNVFVGDEKLPAGVSFWEKYWGLGPCFWCLCFASYCAKAIGGARISGNCTYSVAIEGYARNHENGWVQVRWEDRRPGDVTIWKFAGPNSPSDHGEFYVGNDTDAGGNTSSEGGDQANGGGVFPKQIGSATRPQAALSMVCRPLYG